MAARPAGLTENEEIMLEYIDEVTQFLFEVKKYLPPKERARADRLTGSPRGHLVSLFGRAPAGEGTATTESGFQG